MVKNKNSPENNLIIKIWEAVQSNKPKKIRYKNQTYNVSQEVIDQMKNAKMQDITDEVISKIKENHSKSGGIIPLIPILAGIGAIGSIAGGSAAIASSVNARNHQLKMEKLEKEHNQKIEDALKEPADSGLQTNFTEGEGFVEELGSKGKETLEIIKSFGKQFSKDARRRIKDNLKGLADKIYFEKEGSALILKPLAQDSSNKCLHCGK